MGIFQQISIGESRHPWDEILIACICIVIYHVIIPTYLNMVITVDRLTGPGEKEYKGVRTIRMVIKDDLCSKVPVDFSPVCQTAIC